MLPLVVVCRKQVENVMRVLSEVLEAKGNLSESCIFFVCVYLIAVHVNLTTFPGLTHDLSVHG